MAQKGKYTNNFIIFVAFQCVSD